LSFLIIAELKCYKNRECQNGGRCIEDFRKLSFKCYCPAKYTGARCETCERFHKRRHKQTSNTSHVTSIHYCF